MSCCINVTEYSRRFGLFNQHCDDRHEGVQSYRLRCLHLLSEGVWQVKGSIQRAALQNFSEFQVFGATSWDGFSDDMQAMANCLRKIVGGKDGGRLVAFVLKVDGQKSCRTFG